MKSFKIFSQIEGNKRPDCKGQLRSSTRDENKSIINISLTFQNLHGEDSVSFWGERKNTSIQRITYQDCFELLNSNGKSKQMSNCFKMLKENYFQLSILYSDKLSNK